MIKLVENAHVRNLEEQVKQMELQLQAWKLENQQKLEENQKKVEEVAMGLTYLTSQLNQMFDQVLEALLNRNNSKKSVDGDGILPTPPMKPGFGGGSQEHGGKQTAFHLIPKVELQFFEGNNTRPWTRKCQKVF